MPEALLNIEHLDAYYGKSHILQDVNLQVHPGELVVVVGRNGMGKTTLLKSIMGLPPLLRTGSIFFDGVGHGGKITAKRGDVQKFVPGDEWDEFDILGLYGGYEGIRLGRIGGVFVAWLPDPTWDIVDRHGARPPGITRAM